MLLSLIHTLSCFFWGNTECASFPGTGFKEPVKLTRTTELSSIKAYDSRSLGRQHRRNEAVIPRSIFISSRFGQTSTAKQAETLHTHSRSTLPETSCGTGSTGARGQLVPGLCRALPAIRPSCLAHCNPVCHAHYSVFPTQQAVQDNKI